jgi:hypothetical protein
MVRGGLFHLSQMMIVRVTGLGLSDQDHGQDSPQKSGDTKRRAVYVLVNLCVASVEFHIILLHRYWFIVV